MPEQREYLLYLEDIYESMIKIGKYISDLEEQSFKRNFLVVDAVIRNFEIIGEASKNIPDLIKKKHPDIPWKKMYALRNIISHDYFGIDYDVIWKIASEQLPINLMDLEKVIYTEKHNPSTDIR